MRVELLVGRESKELIWTYAYGWADFDELLN
jgi:hypothetical protein